VLHPVMCSLLTLHRTITTIDLSSFVCQHASLCASCATRGYDCEIFEMLGYAVM